MNETYHALQAMKTQAVINNRDSIPYLYEFYNVKYFTTNPLSSVRDVLARLVNALIKAINDNQRLPHIILVVPDTDLLRFVQNHNNQTELMSGAAVTWITNEMTKAVKC